MTSATAPIGSVHLRVAAPGVVVVSITGQALEAHADEIRKTCDAELAAQKRLHVFFDSDKMSGFDKGFRQRMMVWHASTKGRGVTQTILVKSQIVALAIAAANTFIGGGAEITSNRLRWAQALEVAEADANR